MNPQVLKDLQELEQKYGIKPLNDKQSIETQIKRLIKKYGKAPILKMRFQFSQ